MPSACTILFSQMNFFNHPNSPKMMASGLSGADIFRLRRQGLLGCEVPSITLGVTRVELDWEPANYGNSRPWFLCPECGARRRFLHLRNDRLACRICLDLAYPSRHACWKSAHQLRRAVLLRLRIGASTQPFGDLPPRPRHSMAAQRYDRIVGEILLCQAELLGSTAPAHAALLRRKGAPP
jgi:hypothetical protein